MKDKKEALEYAKKWIEIIKHKNHMKMTSFMTIFCK